MINILGTNVSLVGILQRHAENLAQSHRNQGTGEGPDDAEKFIPLGKPSSWFESG